jgi:indole-3-glycerol phosphate synthase
MPQLVTMPGTTSGGMIGVTTRSNGQDEARSSGSEMLDELISTARVEVARRRAARSDDAVREALAARDEVRPFSEALTRPGLSLIAEFKRRSPTKGPIRVDADLASNVAAYEEGGAAALSVLTEGRHFGGTPEDVGVARQATTLPILWKDFIVDLRQLLEAASSGADAVLLMVAVFNRLDDLSLSDAYAEARDLDLDCVVEVRNDDELEAALEIDADVIGINNRDFAVPDWAETVEVGRTFKLMKDVPAGKTVVSESGISDRDTLEELERVGVDAVLIGEALMRADDPAAKVRELTADEDSTREHLLP